MFKKWGKIVAVIALICLPVIVLTVYRNVAHSIYKSLINYPENVIIATGPADGLYRALSENLAESIRKELKLEVESIGTHGSHENLDRLLNGTSDFALYQPGTMEESGTDIASLPNDVAFVANLYSQPTHFVVRQGAGISVPADLKGKRVQLGLKGSGDYAMSMVLLKHFGIEQNEIDAKFLDYSAVVRGVHEGEIDAAFITIGVQAPVFGQLFVEENCELLSIPFVDALLAKHISLSPYTIPQGMYRTQPSAKPSQDITTVALSAQLLTRTDANNELVREVTELVMRKDFLKRNQLGELYRLGPQYAQRKPEFAIHPGARSFYEPDFDIHIFESFDAIYSLVASILIAGFLLIRALGQRRAMKMEHKLDRHLHALLDIERRQIELDSDSNGKDVDALQELLDEVTVLRQGALNELAAHELNEDRATDSLIQMCHALSNKINAKISRQRLDQRFIQLMDQLPARET